MAARRVLLVDDHRDFTRSLRAALENLSQDIVTVEVHTGEEAILELGRGSVDMMICDVKLPDMNGLDVLKRARRISAGAYTVMMGPPEDAKSQQYAQAMGASLYLKQPVSIPNFMPEAEKILGVTAAAAKAAPPPPPPPPAEQPATIGERLSTLRRDLGANAVYLIDQHGRIAMSAGEAPKLDTASAFKFLVESFVPSLKLCQLLGGFIPSNVAFFDGDDFDLYAANVGQFYALAIVFDGDRGAGQMGPVMRYGRQCADDLLNSLVMMGEPGAASPPLVSAPPKAVATPAPAKVAPPPAVKPAAPPVPEGESPLAAARRAAAAKAAAPPPAYKAPVMEEKPIEPTLKPLSDEEFAKLAAALGPATAAPTPSGDAANFWYMAVNEEEKKDDAKTLSLEEAEKQGLIKK